MIDLHFHSTFSDGTRSPEDLVSEAVASGLQAAVLTDHDTVEGVPRFLAAARAAGLRALSGIEISAERAEGGLHILGYGMDVSHQPFLDMLTWLRRGRSERNGMILEKLRSAGIPLDWKDVRELAGEDVVGRPHFARALELGGWVQDKREAFDRYLGRNGIAYVDRDRLSPQDSIRLIHEAGGAAILAHPATLNMSATDLQRLVAELREQGLDGLECYYSEHDAPAVRRLLRLAETYGLLVSGGSDYHGEATPAIRMGKGFGSLRIPVAVFDAIEKHVGGNRSATGRDGL